MRFALLALTAILATLAAPHEHHAQEPVNSIANFQSVQVETVALGFNNPCGIAIHPETQEIFVSDSGNSRVVKVHDGRVKEVISGFPTDSYGRDPSYKIGPLGIAFLSADTLVVGGGGLPNGKDLLRTFTVSDFPTTADKAIDALALPAAKDLKGEGNFYGLAFTKDAVWTTSNGDDLCGWVARADRDGDRLNNFVRKIPTKQLTQTDAPVAITVSADGSLMTSQFGEIDVRFDSLVALFSPEGRLLSRFETGLNDIVALAVHPETGQIFAADFSWMDETVAGIYLLTDFNHDQGRCWPKLIRHLPRPTAMAFDQNGHLLVTVVGKVDTQSGRQSNHSSFHNAGKLLLIKQLVTLQNETNRQIKDNR